MKKGMLEVSVFVCGAVVMVLELVGSRILAPFVGTSTIVWTSLIGVILASLSAGYYLGGKRADRHADATEYAQLMVWGAVGILVTAVINTHVLLFVQSTIHSVYLAAIVSAIVLFAPASIVLGMISPYAAKLRLQHLADAGVTIGTLYALSTIGSIVGTFFAGFVLLAWMGSTMILYVLTITLVVLSLVVSSSQPWGRVALAVLAMMLGLNAHRLQEARAANGFVDRDTAYTRALIRDITWKDGRPVRVLQTDAFGAQSGMYLDDHPNELVFFYTRLYDLVDHFAPDAQRTLMIGGAAYSYPKSFLERHSDAKMDVVEIDPGLTALAHAYFGLKEDPRLTISHEDGRQFLNEAPRGGYDAVFIDAFTSLTPPPQLTTLEAVQAVERTLTPRGVLLTNVISALEGKGSQMLQAEYATYARVFPHVFVFQADPTVSKSLPQNVLLVAVKGREPIELATEDSVLGALLARRIEFASSPTIPVLTDEYAPVERYTQGLYR